VKKDAVKAKILPVLKKHGVLRARLFGSVVRGEASAGSDVDLLVVLPDGKTLLDLVELKIELEEILGVPVDVLTEGGLHPALRPRIEEEAEAVL